jgi:hypothetical protein
MRRVLILGSTGSIGTQASTSSRRTRTGSSWSGCRGQQADLLEQQAEEFGVDDTALGAAEAEQLVRDVEADVVLNAITGSIGLGSTLAALKAGRTLALANKESLIVGGASSPRSRSPVRSCPSTPSTPRSRGRCARHEAGGAPPRRHRLRALPGRTRERWRRSPPRRSPTPPGTWVAWSRRTRRRS